MSQRRSHDGGSGVATLLHRLQEAAAGHLQQRLAPASIAKLKSVMRHLRGFAKAVAGVREPLFREPRAHGDMQALLWNEWSLVLFLEYLALRRSARTGRHLAANTVAEYVQMAKVELSTRWGFAIAGVPQRLPAVLKGLRRARPGQERRKRRGVRRAHLRRAWEADAGLAADKAAAANRWAAGATAWQAVARGGEVATPLRALRRWRARDRPTRADLEFGESGGRRWACVWLRPIKRRNGESAERVPIFFEEGDGGGDDAYAALERMARLDPVPERQRAAAPLFREGTQPMTVESLRAHARAVMRAAGQASRGIGAHSFRIGGCTELAAQGASPMLLQAKGRWASDIARIYARLTRRAQLLASRAMQRGGAGRDLEELFPSYAQRA